MKNGFPYRNLFFFLFFICSCFFEMQSQIKEKDGTTYTLKSYPNPFKEEVEISIKNDNATDQKIRLEIFDLVGRKIKEWNLNVVKDSSIKWNGMSSDGKQISPGIYVLRLQSGSETISSKLVKRN